MGLKVFNRVISVKEFDLNSVCGLFGTVPPKTTLEFDGMIVDPRSLGYCSKFKHVS